MTNLQTHLKGVGLLFGLALLAWLPLGAFSQALPGYLAGQITVGENPTVLNGNLTVGSSGELYLGNHFPAGQQTHTLLVYGDYIGEGGSRLYLSVTGNDNNAGHGFVQMENGGTATKTGTGTSIVLDLFNGWDGACIDLVSAHESSDPQTFRMDETTVSSGHTALLRYRKQNANLIWYIAEKIIRGQQSSAQTRCLNDPLSFDPLTVQTVSGTYQYQWYRCEADKSNAVNLGAANGAQTASYTPTTNVSGTNYYYCVVTSQRCGYGFNADTTAVSGAITVSTPARIITQPIDQSVCNTSNVNEVTLTVEAEGDALVYQWFKNGQPVANSNAPELTVNVSGGIDRYFVEINGCKGMVRSTTVEVRPALDLIVQRVNTTLLINNNSQTNGGYKFAHYTWYKDDVKIAEGEHDSDLGGHYYTGGASLDPYAAYWAELITTAGEHFRTCDFTPTIYAQGVDIRAYPSPVKASSSGMVTVEITGMKDEELQTATIDIFYSSGVYLGKVHVNGLQKVPVQLPRITGVYVLQFKSDNVEKVIKIVVE